MRFFAQKEKPKIKIRTIQSEQFEGWNKCQECGQLVHNEQLKSSCTCCPKCGFHYRITAKERISLLVDLDSFIPLFEEVLPLDPLEFVDEKPYKERLFEAQKKTELSDAIITGTCSIDGRPLSLGVMDFNFLGGSMGSVVGERVALLAEYALKMAQPLLLVTASGGARMQESIFSLMQMAKTSMVIARLKEKGIPFITLLTNPTTGGVTASFATQADIIIAEPKALICFAGPRVIEQTTKQKPPQEAQKAEYLLDHGMVDKIVERKEQRAFISFLLRFFKK